MLAPSIFLETAVEHVGLVFVAKKSGAQRFIIDARPSNRHFLRPPSWPLHTSEAFCHVEFQRASEDAQKWFVGSADIKNAFHQMRSLGWLQASFALPAVLASESGYTGKTADQKRLIPVSSLYFVPTTLPMGLSWVFFFCQDVTDHSTLAGSAGCPFFRLS